MRKITKIIISTILPMIFFFSFFGLAMAVPKSIQNRFPIKIKNLITEVIDSTTYTKNADGTINKIEKITRTTIINPTQIVNQINTLKKEKQALIDQKAVLDTVK